MRVIILTVLFFIFIGIGLIYYKDEIMASSGKNFSSSLMTPLLRDTLNAHQNIDKANKNKQAATFILGASFAAPYYDASRELQDKNNIYSLVSGSEIIPDWIRLVDNIEPRGSTVVLVIAPHKFANMQYHQSMIETHYINGVAGKFLLPSKNFNALWEEYKKNNDVKKSYFNNFHWRIFQPFMPYVHYMNDLISETSRRQFGKIKEILIPDIEDNVTKFPDGFAHGKDYFTFNVLDIDISNKKYLDMQEVYSYSSLNDHDYLNHISDKKLKEFRNWLDAAKHQFDESIIQSFIMLEKVIEIARLKNFNIIIAEAPTSKIEDMELMPFIEEYEKKLDELVSANKAKHDIKIIRFDRKKFNNSQRFFADYVHINEDGFKHFKEYFLSIFKFNFKNNQFPKNWEIKNTISLRSKSFVKNNFLNKDFEKKISIINSPRKFNISNLDFTHEAFVDVIDEKIPMNTFNFDRHKPISETIEIERNLNDDYEYLNVLVQSKFSDGTSFDLTWPSSENDKISKYFNYPLFITPYIWSFNSNDKKKIEEKFKKKFSELNPGDMWTELNNVPIESSINKLFFKYHENIKTIELSKSSLKKLFYHSEISKINESTVKFNFPDINSNQTHGKIAHSGILLNFMNIQSFFYVDSKHNLFKVNSDFKYRYGSFIPHTFGFKLTNGQFKTIIFNNTDLIDINFDSNKNILTFMAYDYHAHENYSFAYDLVPYSVEVKDNKLNALREYRNLGITDSLNSRSLSFSVIDTNEILFPLWQKEGKRATLVFLEHADYLETINDPLIMFGNKENIIRDGEGFLGNKIPITKTIFMTGESFEYQVKINENFFNFIQPTFQDNKYFANYLKDLYKTGLVEIGLHSFGTIPYALKPESFNEALEIFKREFNGRIWTDHGSMPSNISFNGWDRRLKDYYILDDLEKFSIDYLWAGPDYGASKNSHSNKELSDINMIQDNAANSIFYELPNLKTYHYSNWKPKFFRTIEYTSADLPTLNDIEKLIEDRGISLLHCYLGQTAVNYVANESESKSVALIPKFNSYLKEIANLRDNRLLNIEKLSDFLDYQNYVRNLNIFQSRSGNIFIKSTKKMNDVSFAKINFDIKSNCNNDSNKCSVIETTSPIKLNAYVNYFTLNLNKGNQLIVNH